MRVENQTFTLNSNTSTFEESYYPVINLDSSAHHEIALLSLDMYHSIPNITSKNCVFRYEYEGKECIICLPTGAYEIKRINEYIMDHLEDLYEEKELFRLSANISTLRCVIEIFDPDVKILFDGKNNMKTMLGFNVNEIAGVGKHEAHDLAKIISFNQILVHCNLIKGSYLQNEQKRILYNFFPMVEPGYKIREEPNVVVYYTVKDPAISKLQLWITDQKERPIDVRGEDITIRLHLRSTYF